MAEGSPRRERARAARRCAGTRRTRRGGPRSRARGHRRRSCSARRGSGTPSAAGVWDSCDVPASATPTGAFRAALAEPEDALTDDALAAALEAALETGHEAWPELLVEPAAFAAYLAARVAARFDTTAPFADLAIA